MSTVRLMNCNVCDADFAVRVTLTRHIKKDCRFRSGLLKMAPVLSICLINITQIAKSALHILQFVRQTVAALYYTAVGLEKI